MASTSEVGHAKNVANLQDLISFVSGYGSTYNPSKANLKLTTLETMYTQATDDLAEVVNKKTNYNNKVNERIQAFDGIRALSTRLVNALSSTDASKEKVADAKSYNTKIQGQRKSKATAPSDPNAPVPKTISTSQQSYDQIIEHLQGLISVLESETSYTPNETDLQIATLQAKVSELKVANEKVATAYTSVSNARITRNNTLYKEDSGLVDTAADVKNYIKSIFGASSPEFAQIKGIAFTNVRSLS